MKRRSMILGVVAGLVLLGAERRPADDTVTIAGGTFFMGIDPGAIPELRKKYGVSFPGSFESEVPGHEVTLDSYRIDAHEVTNGEFAEFLAVRPELARNRPVQGPEEQQLPVVFVTWNGAQAYCRWAGGRLPTEAEWEYAARSRDTREFPWGNELPSPALANYGASGIDGPVPVATYNPNGAGLYDMAGNVWEWVLDAWQPTYETRGSNPVAGGAVPDSVIPRISGRRVIRGGSFGGSVVNLRTRWRDSHDAGNAKEFVGFRCSYPAP